MALTVNDFESTLTAISDMLAAIRSSARQVKASTARSLVDIQALASDHAEVLEAISSIDPETADSFEKMLLAKKTRLDAEVTDLLSKLNAARTALAVLDL